MVSFLKNNLICEISSSMDIDFLKGYHGTNVVAIAVLSIFIAFYDEFEITKVKMFPVFTLLLFCLGLVVSKELPGVTVLLMLLFLTSMSNTVRQGH